MLNDEALAKKAITRVEGWLAADSSNRDKSAQRLADLLQDPAGLQFSIDFVDRVVRPEDMAVCAREFRRLGSRAPKFLEAYLRAGVRLGGLVSRALPGVVVPAAKRAMRHLVGHLVIDARPQQLGKHLARLRSNPKIQLNVNLLGEAVLGRSEADHRLHGTEELLRRDDVDYVSIKVSAVAPQLNMWAFEETIDEVTERLRPLYEIAAKHNKFINLDMEEYRDLDLTIEVFTRILSKPEFKNLHAGIVLQTYLPDALGALQRLTAWSIQRKAEGGAGIKVRVVKGANLAMERVDAAIHDWPLTVQPSKAASDANYKRVLRYALQPNNAEAVRIGVAGHNLFDLSYAIELANHYGTKDSLDVEMLLGMAEEHMDTVGSEVGRIVLYTPVVQPKDFDAAVAYLVRRLEENGSSENFMSGMFSLDDEKIFNRERDRFLASLDLMYRQDEQGLPQPNRKQNRTTHPEAVPAKSFRNEPDTDPALAANREWARAIIERVPTSQLGMKPASPAPKSVEALDEILFAACAAAKGWQDRGAAARRELLYAAADTISRHRADLIEVMASETGKTIAEGDVEVSEAIDFCRYYADCCLELEQLPGVRPVQLTVVVPPWNFPTAIPCGGIVAALATGSSVVVKPAPQSRRTASVLVEALWEAGIPREVLRFLPLGEDDIAKALITNPRVERLIFTGSSATAEMFSSWRPELTILGETSGKNGIIVMPDADLDLAANDLAKSAFMHAGQKCSAASLGILVGSVGTSDRFLNQLKDAVSTFVVDYPDNPRAQVGPLIEPAAGKLKEALTQLQKDEQWLLKPQQLDDSGRLWRPGIRRNVRPGSFTHLNEFFGPHLCLISVRNLDEALAVQNGTAFGLTAGIHSLDADTVTSWVNQVQAGNLYVNRGITGAIVRRQPFGGWKLSQCGPGAKAGGPNYLLSLVDFQPTNYDSDGAFLRAAVADDEKLWKEEFSQSKDVSALGVERNIFRYRPTREVLIRASEDARQADLQRVLSAVKRSGSTVRLSTHLPIDTANLDYIVECTIENDEEFHRSLAKPGFFSARENFDEVRRLRLIGNDRELRKALAGQIAVALYDQPVTALARVEMLPFLREQAVSITAHRYGNPDPRFLGLEV